MMTEPNNYHQIIKYLWSEFLRLKFEDRFTQEQRVDENFKELYTIGWLELQAKKKLSKQSYDLLGDILNAK